MMKRENLWKVVICGALLLTVVATGVTLYNTGKEDESEKAKQNQIELVEKDSDKNLQEDEPFEAQDVVNDSAKAENYQEENEEPSKTLKPTEITDDEDEKIDESTDTSGKVLPVLDFNEDSVMVWPVNGELLIDYSMETTTYFPTLNQYKCSNGVVIAAEVGTAVQAAADGKILSIVENEETGLTVVMDLGNGYHAVYGQLRALNASVGQTLEQGEILGYVQEPTKYFVKEGSNLYFAMKKEGIFVDPMLYLETVTE